MLKDGQTVKYPGTKKYPYVGAAQGKAAFKSTESMNLDKKSKLVKTALTNYEGLLW